MASKNPGACCVHATLHEGEPKGQHQIVAGVDSYVAGAENGNDNIIVILPDIYGYKFKNNMLIADEVARLGKYKVLVPDLAEGGDPPASLEFLPAWFEKHPNETTTRIVKEYLTTLYKETTPKFLGGIGHCYGAKFAIEQASKDGNFDAIAIAHPSQVSIDQVKALTKPILISAAETDPIFTRELRWETEEALTEIKVRYQMDLFQGVSHGYAVRGDITNPSVKYAKEKTLTDQLAWFSQFK
ncbi:dienelactone hydrolase [Hyphopichia burtonii NRRL Y-1933]|uniref:Dienelactone hydrolase n=1 Tax=Hyphopichia burtonii NRRL Y-1933 TaxID=984485 RepID=A0A1E4RHE6_9ASCO|nr:dienelactone hydrolase [Hyphopichia burtonii NRRL Y-1933]ODV66636.1 dienelactone hydrolase [Hyphopichia burtonii NRRL Y-1933]